MPAAILVPLRKTDEAPIECQSVIQAFPAWRLTGNEKRSCPEVMSIRPGNQPSLPGRTEGRVEPFKAFVTIVIADNDRQIRWPAGSNAAASQYIHDVIARTGAEVEQFDRPSAYELDCIAISRIEFV